MKEKIIGEEPVGLPFVKELLEKIKGEGELNFRAQKTLEHAESAKFAASAAQKLVDGLMKMEIPRFKDLLAHKIVETAPMSSDEVRVVLSGYNLNLSKDHLKKIADAVVAAKPKQ